MTKFRRLLYPSVADEMAGLADLEIYKAMGALLSQEGIVAEGGGAVAYAAVLASKLELRGPAAIVISGRNVDVTRLCAIAAGKPVTLGNLVVGPD